MKIIIDDKVYNVKEAKTPEETHKGLKGVEELPTDEGMLFYVEDPKKLITFTMKDCLIPLDIIYLNQDMKVVDVISCEPKGQNIINSIDHMDDDDLITYVLELNKNSGVKIGLEVDNDEDGPVMKVLAPDGSTLMELWGGERIFSRKNTKVLIRKAKKAQESKDDSDYKSLGKYMFKCIKVLDEREPEYVNSPKKED